MGLLARRIIGGAGETVGGGLGVRGGVGSLWVPVLLGEQPSPELWRLPTS